MFHRKWTKITGDQWVLETLLEGLKLEFMSHPCLNIKETSVSRYGIHESHSFRSSKTTRRSATDSQSETSKPNSSASSFQDGNTPFNYESFKKGRLCSNFGFSRCIFSYPNSHRLQTIPEIPISRSELPISSNAIRAQICPKSVHKDHGCIIRIPTKVNDSDIHVTRRLADQQFRQNSSCKANAFFTPSSSRFGTYSKSEKVKLYTNPTYRILGSPFHSRERDSNTNRDKISKYFGNNTCITKQSTDSSSSNFKITRSDGFMHLPNTHGKITYEANPTLFVSTMVAKHPTIESVHSCTNELDSTFKMVDKSDKYFQRNAFTGADNSVDIDHRCLRTRMGSSSRNLADIRNMAKVLSTKTYKLVGIEGCTVSSSRSCTNRERHEYFNKVGQYNSDKLYQQAGNPFARTVLPNLGPLPMVYSEQSNYPCSSHSGKDKSTSRCSFEGEKSFQDDRVDTQQYDSKYDISETGNSKYRSVCNSSEQKVSSLLLSGSRHSTSSISSRCSNCKLERHVCICISSSNPCSSDITKDSRRKDSCSSNSTNVAKTILVSSDVGSTDRYSNKTTTSARNIESCGMEIIKLRHKSKGFSEKTAEIMANARKTSTQTVYDARLRIYDSWCKEQNINSTSSTIPEVAEFLLYLSTVRKCKAQTITGYKSAIALIHNNGLEISNSSELSSLIKGLFNMNPPIRQLTPNWNLPLVLLMLTIHPFEPLDSIELKFLTFKTAFLVAIAPASRVSEIHSLSLDDGHFRF
ncbi:uncharacterized protein [Mytilus edulis]|uniref:uncharacterized protein n=1 Tax=Mytilus edulis TaxID=6550 RepID=UPI0039F0BA3C